ncbi:MAG: LCP family protein [Caldilineaceae bacterium]|nr:LCP family protein [Caldilineaceae bacterium]
MNQFRICPPARSSQPVLITLWIIFVLFLTSCGSGSQSVAAQSSTPTAATGTTLTASAVATATADPTAAPATETPAQEPSPAPLQPSAAAPTTAVAATTAVAVTSAGTATTAAMTEETLPLARTLNILILGSDRLPNTPNWRTDVMMVVALDFDAQRIGVLSIPRDLYLDAIPKHQPNKMNVLDYLGERDEPNGGGPKLIKQMIQERMGLTIHHYLRFDFNSFQAVVNALGGVKIDIDCRYVDAVINLQPGEQRLTGEQALRYVRSRSTGGDLDRARRQQRIVWAVRNQVLEENLLPRLPALYQSLAGSIQTDIGLVTALRVARFVLGINPDNVHSFVIAPPQLVTEGWRQGMFVFVPDWPAITAAAQKIFDRPPFMETSTPSVCP